MGTFDRADPERLVAMIDLNVTSLTLLTRAFLPAMVRQRKGGVINISSGFGLSVMPSFAAYCATKHYVTGLTEALIGDLAGTGVVVTQVLPGPVATEFDSHVGNFTGQQAPKIVEITAERCARSTIRGFDRGRAMVVPGILITLLLWVNALSPRFMRRFFASILGKIAKEEGRSQTMTISECLRSAIVEHLLVPRDRVRDHHELPAETPLLAEQPGRSSARRRRSRRALRRRVRRPHARQRPRRR